MTENPFRVERQVWERDKPYAIVDSRNGRVVGRSDALDKAERSAGYRFEGEQKKAGNN